MALNRSLGKVEYSKAFRSTTGEVLTPRSYFKGSEFEFNK